MIDHETRLAARSGPDVGGEIVAGRWPRLLSTAANRDDVVAEAREGGSCGLSRRRFCFWARVAELGATFVETEQKNPPITRKRTQKHD